MVDKSLLSRKLDRIKTYLDQMGRKDDPGVKTFTKDSDLQSIILFNLIQTVQICIDIGAHIISDSGWNAPSTQAEIFEILTEHKVISKLLAKKMVRMCGFRNRIVHEYEKTDMKIVHAVWKKISVRSFIKKLFWNTNYLGSSWKRVGKILSYIS